MQRVTIRLPEDVVDAYDEAPGNRSKLMREQLTKPVAHGELDVPTRLQKLARAERAKQQNRWEVKDAGLRGRAYRFVKQRWEEGTHPPDALDRALSGFRQEAAMSDDSGAEDYIDRMAVWVTDAWPEDNPGDRPEFPDAAEFHDGVPGVGPVNSESRTLRLARDAVDRYENDQEAFDKLTEKMPESTARAAMAQVQGE